MKARWRVRMWVEGQQAIDDVIDGDDFYQPLRDGQWDEIEACIQR